jgi:two-component system LytT family response regulator
MGRIKAVVVEDQPLSREHIVKMLQQAGVDVIGTCANGLEALEKIPALAPDVVFLDVQMPALNGFEVIEAIGPDAMPPVVFVTAFDAYMLKAFDVFALGYLLKPINAEKLTRIVGRLESDLSPKGRARASRGLAGLLARSRESERLVVRDAGRVVFISPGDIEWIEACGNYALIHTGGARHITRQALHALQRRLPGFARVRRSALVNLRAVRELRQAGHGECDVVLQNGTTLRVTRRFRAQLEQRMRELP